MVEDKLTRVERIRLESLAMTFRAMDFVGPQARPTLDDVFASADKIEAWLRKAPMDPSPLSVDTSFQMVRVGRV